MFVIETMTPEGPHWYEGWKQQRKGEHVIQGLQWTPYWEDVFLFEHIETAEIELEKVSRNMPGAKIVPMEKANKQDRWILIADNMISIRAKYLKVGQHVTVSGYNSVYLVAERGKDNFKLTSNGRNTIYIGVNSNKRVFVTFKQLIHE
jgi:hypothetical protein